MLSFFKGGMVKTSETDPITIIPEEFKNQPQKTYWPNSAEPPNSNVKGFVEVHGQNPWGSYTGSSAVLDPNPNNTVYHKRIYGATLWDKRPWYSNMQKFMGQIDYYMKKDPKDMYALNPFKYYSGGQIDWKSHKFAQTPDFLHAENWKPVTTEEVVAQQERSEIVGRNRRYFWKLMLNPRTEQHFFPVTTDAQYIKQQRVHSQFFQLFYLRRSAGQRWKLMGLYYLLPTVAIITFAYTRWYNGDITPHWAAANPKHGNNAMNYMDYGLNTDNQFTMSSDKNGHWGWGSSWLSSILSGVYSAGDDWSTIQATALKANKAASEGKVVYDGKLVFDKNFITKQGHYLGLWKNAPTNYMMKRENLPRKFDD